MKHLIVEREKIMGNVQAIKTAAGEAQLIAVLKGNAYGLGLRQMASLLRELEVRRFAVNDPIDAVKLREWGFAEEELLVLRSTAVEQDIRNILESGATATIGSYDAAVALNGMAEAEGLSCDVHIKIDTGMGRYGFSPNEFERITSLYRFMPNLNVTGMYTHYANAFCNLQKTKAQYDIFMALVTRVREAGFEPGLLHASNSAALLSCSMPSMDAVRIGSAIGGRTTAKGEFGLQKVGKLSCPITEIRWIQNGATVGYGSAFVAKRPTKIAVVPVGSQDGFLLEKARDTYRFSDTLRYCASAMLGFFKRRRVYVFVEGKRARVLGHVGLNHTIVDVTEIDCSPGSTATFEVSPIFVPFTCDRQYV